MKTDKRTVVIGMLGVQLDQGKGDNRWLRWRPTVSLAQMDDLVLARLELIHDRKFQSLAKLLVADVQRPDGRGLEHTGRPRGRRGEPRRGFRRGEQAGRQGARLGSEVGRPERVAIVGRKGRRQSLARRRRQAGIGAGQQRERH